MDNRMYDAIDMRNARQVGFWLGATSGALGMFILALLVGLYVNV